MQPFNPQVRSGTLFLWNFNLKIKTNTSMQLPSSTLRQALITSLLASLPFTGFAQDTFPLDNFDLVTGEDPIGGRYNLWQAGVNRLFQNATGAATYVEGEALGISGDEQMTVSFPTGSYVHTPFRYIGDEINGPASDPFFALLNTYPVIEFEVVNNGSASVGIGLSINTDDGFEYNVISAANLSVAPGASATYQFNLGNDSTYLALRDAWTAGRFDLRVLQGTPSGTTSDVTYDNFKLREPPPEGLLEDYDTVLGFFQQFNGNAVYTVGDFDADEDNELKIDIQRGGFAMGLRHVFSGSDRANDTLLLKLQELPEISFDYVNLGDDLVTIGIVLASTDSEFLPAWLAFGSVDVEAGESGTYSFNLFSDAEFSSIIEDWIAGSGTNLQFRILQDTEEGVPSIVVWDNITLSEASLPLVPEEWTETVIGDVYGYSGLWGYSPYMGIVYFGNLPWIYQEPFGWMALVGSWSVDQETYYWFYNDTLGYIYTSDSLEGWFSAQNSAWAWDNFLDPLL